MLNKIIDFSIKNKLIVAIGTIMLIAYGVFEVTQLPIDAVPDITNNQVQIITVAPSFGATDIERWVTFPIEQANSNISGIKEIRSFSRFGLSLVTIVFDDNIDVYWARQQVAERLQKVQNEIPKGIGTPELGPVTTGLGEIYQYIVRAKKGYEQKYDITELRTIQDWVVRRQLLGVKGVAEVSSFGGKLKQYEIAVNTNKLQAYHLTIKDVFDALEKNNQNTGGAYIEKGSSVLFIRSDGLIATKEEIENIAVRSTNGGIPLFMKDVAEIKIGYATRYGAMCYNDEGEVAGAIVMMLKGANSSKVIKEVKNRITQIQASLPEGVVIEPFLDRTKMVNHAIGTVEKNLIEGALIVIFVLVFFLGNLRAGLLVASVIPLAMLFAIIMMNTFGVSGNLMSLGALDFGLIVDGAVIIVEAVMHQLTHNKRYNPINQLSQKEMDTAVSTSAGKMMNSAVFGQIIILIVYLPIFTLQGIEGKMFKPMAQTVAFALLGAFLLSLTYIPMMSAFVLSKKINHTPTLSDKWMLKIETLYQRALTKILHIPKLTLSVVFILFVTALYTLSTLGGEFIPALEEGDFAVDTRVLTGSSLSTTIERTQQAAHILKTRFPEVQKVVAKIGSGEVPTDPMPMEACDMMVILKDKKDWTSAKTFNELADKMGKALQDVPGITTGFQYPVQMRFNELMTGARQDVVCKIFGENMDTLAAYAAKLGHVAQTVQGTQNLYIEPVTGIQQVVITYNRALIAQYKLNIEDVNKVVNMAFAGQSAGLLFEGEKRFDIVVKLDNTQRNKLEDIQNLLIPTPDGTQIPLYQVAEVAMKEGPNQIQREDAKRRIVVGFNIHNRDVQSIVQELQQKVSKQIKLPAGYYVTYGGAFENLNAAKQRLMIAVPVSLLMIFILLYFAFASVKQGLMIYTAIPLSAIGGIFFLAIRGLPFSISAGVGFIALFGVAVLNGIVLIAEFNRLKAEGKTNLYRIVLMGTKMRLRPVLMTAFVASLGFLPMALSHGAGAEVQRPLATVVIGGLLIATFLTLFVLPILYIIVETGFKRKSSFKINSTVLMLFILTFNYSHSKAQTITTLQQAIDTALKNNLSIKQEQLKVKYKEKLTHTAADLPHTALSFETGQINSIYVDTKLGLSQSFNFPTVYKKQKQLLQEQWKSAILEQASKTADIKKMVVNTYYLLCYYKQKELLCIKNDSIYSLFLQLATQRVNKGESNILEKITAEHQRALISIQLEQIRNDIKVLNDAFQVLINTTTPFSFNTSDFYLHNKLTVDSTTLEQHPFLKNIAQQQAIAKVDIKLEKAKLLPDFSVGYYAMSIKGMGANNKYYNNAPQFQAAQIGIGVPLFYGAQKNKINASKINEAVSKNEYDVALQQWQSQLTQVFLQYNTLQDKVEYYETAMLKQTDFLLKTANTQLENGAINYLEWTMLVNQAALVQSDYLDALKDLQDSIAQINYLTSK